MAIDSIFTIVGQQKGWPEFTLPAAQFKLADISVNSTQVAAGGQGDCGSGMRWFRAAIFQKGAVPSTVVAGSASANGTYSIEVSPVVGFSAGTTRMVASGVISRVFSSIGTVILCGQAPDNPTTTTTGYQFVRISYDAGCVVAGASAVSFDTIIEAC